MSLVSSEHSTKMSEIAPTSSDHYFRNNRNGYSHSTSASGYAGALRKVALALSLGTLTTLIAVLVILDAFSFRYKSEAKEATIVFIEWIAVIVVLSTIVVWTKAPSLLKAIADFAFTWRIISCLISFMNEFPHYEWCYEWGKTTPVYPQCVQWRLILTILMGVSSGFAIILGAIFVLLLLHGIYEFIRSPYWQKISRKFPSGEISFTIKFNSAARSDSEAVVQEAMSAPTGQGPVHI